MSSIAPLAIVRIYFDLDFIRRCAESRACKTCSAAATPVSHPPCAVEKSPREQASPAKKSRPSTGAASAARQSAIPGIAYEYEPAQTDPRASDGCELVVLFAQICCRAGRPAAILQNQKRPSRHSPRDRLRTVPQSKPRFADGRMAVDDKSPWLFGRWRRTTGCLSRTLRHAQAREKVCRRGQAADFELPLSCREVGARRSHWTPQEPSSEE